MRMGKNASRGFTLIASLLVLVLLSGVAAGLLYMVTNESKMGGNDLESNLAYYGAESGMEKLTADLSSLYSTYMSPTNAQIQALVTNPPTSSMVPSMSYTESITYPLNSAGAPASSWNTVSQGSNQGLYAEIIPMTLQVTATRPSNALVNMTRRIEVALIPVFQFGVFCGYDCSYFAGPNFAFGGRVHTNSNLFVATKADLVFTDKVAAYKQIVMDRLENGSSTSSNGYTGTTYLPTASGGCVLAFPPTYPPTGSNCKSLLSTVPGDASWSGGYPGIGGSANTNFPSLSSGTLNGYLVNSLTGATNMQLPFVQNSCVSNPPPCTDPISIIRKPLVGESSTSTLGSERLYNKAEIRILLADTQADLHPERGALGDGQDFQFYATTTNSVTGTPQTYITLANAGVTGNEYFGVATPTTNSWVAPYGTSWSTYPLLGEVTTSGIPSGGQGAWMRIEYLNNSGTWVGITTNWLKYGFSRKYNTPPTAPEGSTCTAATTSSAASCPDPINPNAIIILQQLLSSSGATAEGANNLFYPINFYDPREGEMRDNANGCAANGLMNTVELNVGNLAKWLAASGPYSGDVGASVNSSYENGYVLYFSDHRGMLTDPHPTNGTQTPAGIISGVSGLEDVVNSGQPLTSITPDGTLEPALYYTYSPEDVDQNGYLDNWGGVNIGYGFGVNTNTTPPNPYLTTTCTTTGLANQVSGARHVLRLVDAGMNSSGTSYLPTPGFTVASENPVYVNGDYNSGVNDPFWTTGSGTTPHSNASIIADSVSLLSNSWLNSTASTNNNQGWNDFNSLTYPTCVTVGTTCTIYRNATTTYYRAAISAGKNIPFPQPGFTNVAVDFGTDGGMHNFLRLLENWGNATLNYNGSLVSMYYSEYNTGAFKCCTVVYSAPTRNFYFDSQFLNPSNLPPATPMFQDVVDLSYHQNFTPN